MTPWKPLAASKKAALDLGDGAVERQQGGRHGLGVAHDLAALEQFDRLLRPYRPVAEQATGKTQRTGMGDKGQDQVEDDVVVIAGIERHPIGCARSGDAMHDVERRIAVERGDLDADHVVDLRETAPERFPERNAPPTAGCR